jgi:hypothetical protein
VNGAELVRDVFAPELGISEIKGQVICKIPPNNQMLVQKSVASQSGPGGGSREAQGSEVAASDPSY